MGMASIKGDGLRMGQRGEILRQLLAWAATMSSSKDGGPDALLGRQSS